MTLQATEVPVRTETEVKAAIDALDLDPIKFKLMDKHDGPGWAREKAEEVERWYKRFLFLNFKHRDKSIVPTKTIDEFWHKHILDTQKYAEDCRVVFGFFLHHFPYFGVRGEDDAAQLREAFLETRRIFSDEFGEELPVEASGCSECDSSACDDPP